MSKHLLKVRPLALIILDGFGHSLKKDGSAVKLAHTPFLNRYNQEYKHPLIEGSGEHIGLPPGQFGNSEVGHMNIGAGRIVQVEMTRIDEVIKFQRQTTRWRRPRRCRPDHPGTARGLKSRR
jgi:2,3-bisphosphoglycerate-independent phosphoglycerate mutase